MTTKQNLLLSLDREKGSKPMAEAARNLPKKQETLIPPMFFSKRNQGKTFRSHKRHHFGESFSSSHVFSIVVKSPPFFSSSGLPTVAAGGGGRENRKL